MRFKEDMMRREAILLCMVFAFASTAAGVSLSDNMADGSNWTAGNVFMSNYGVYSGLQYHSLNYFNNTADVAWSYHDFGAASAVNGESVNFDADLSYRLYANSLDSDTTYNFQVGIAIAALDGSVDLATANWATISAGIIASASQVYILDSTSALSSGSVEGSNLWSTQTNTADSVTITAADAGKNLVAILYTTKDQDISTNPGSGYMSGFGDVNITPEPATMALLGLGGLLLRRKKISSI